jgi:TrmH family RNA methyltransferase
MVEEPVMLSRAKLKAVASLRDAPARRKAGLMLIEGAHLVMDGCARGVVREVFLSPSCRDAAAIRAAAQSTPVIEVSDADLDRMVEVRTPSGAAATATLNRPAPASELLAAHARALYVDGVQDPGNVGTLARTARALGVGALLLSSGTADPTSPKTLRSSAGSLLDFPYAAGVEPAELLAAARAAGHAVLAAATRGGGDYRGVRAPARWILVVGNEGAGARIGATTSGVHAVTIALGEGSESLNVAAAAAILLARLRDG